MSAKNTLAVTLAFAMLSTACSITWVATLDSVVAAAAPALINILQIVAVANGQPLNSGLAAKISTDATAIKTLAADFAKVSPASVPGVCRQLQMAVSVYEADQQLVLETAQGERPKHTGKNCAAGKPGGGNCERSHGSNSIVSERSVVKKPERLLSVQRDHVHSALQQRSGGKDRQRARWMR